MEPDYRVLSVRTIALAALALVLVGVGVAAWLLFAYGNGTTESANRLDAIKTAGTIVVGTGGAGALWLAARRQRTSELALRQKDLDHTKVDRAYALQERMAAASDADAIERRVTDLYTKAADQLGSDKAPVRLAGMYALERLAQSTPEQRQTIVNVLCAYLRMPYSPSELREKDESKEQERQVRLTAQRILASHLQMDEPTYWPDVDLDLTGATLLDWRLTGCTVRSIECVGTRFIGDCAFDDTEFQRAARFDGARFDAPVTFIRTAFVGVARFSMALFEQEVSFDRARFRADAPFSATHFTMDSSFVDAVFESNARFGSAVFARDALFRGTRFGGPTQFGRTEFNGAALFHGVTFAKETRFDKSEFETLAEFKVTLFDGYVEFSEAQFKGDTRFSRVMFADSARFATTRFSGDTQFEGTKVRLDVPSTVVRAWPRGFTVGTARPESDGDWGLLIDGRHVPPPAVRSG